MQRERLTITLRKDLLPEVDRHIDKVKIRNRSHAIEYLLTKSLKPHLRKALVLCGGRGIKMRPFTYEMPKAMLPVHNRPILEYIIDLLRNNEIREIVILVGHLKEKITSHFGDGSKFGVKIIYIEEKTPEGTAAPILKAKKYLKGEPFLLMYGDVLADIKIKEFFEFHQEHGNMVSMALSSATNPEAYGMVKLRGNKIMEFKEKPEKTESISRLISAGIYILEPEIFSHIPAKKHSSLEHDLFPKLASEGKLSGWPFEGLWFDISTPEIYGKALKEWKK